MKHMKRNIQTFPEHERIQEYPNEAAGGFFVQLQANCIVLRINLDCNACCRKARRILRKMKEVDTHTIDKQECRIVACGRFRPSDVAVKLQKKMNRRVEIMEMQQFGPTGEPQNI